MARHICIYCGNLIIKSPTNDPYICWDCEKLLEGAELEEKYSYLENY